MEQSGRTSEVKVLSRGKNLKKSFSIPLLIQPHNRTLYAFFALGLSLVLYGSINHSMPIAGNDWPFTSLDPMIPFVPLSIWIYLLEVPLFFASAILCRNHETLNKLFFAFCFVQVVSTVLFLIAPSTHLARDNFLRPDIMDPITYAAYEILFKMDNAYSCFPSLHVGSVLICALAFLHENRKKFIFFMTWAMLISISTVTTKQHYFLDVVGGALLAYVSYRLFFYHVHWYDRLNKKV